jgi:hypothetical protein
LTCQTPPTRIFSKSSSHSRRPAVAAPASPKWSAGSKDAWRRQRDWLEQRLKDTGNPSPEPIPPAAAARLLNRPESRPAAHQWVRAVFERIEYDGDTLTIDWEV